MLRRDRHRIGSFRDRIWVRLDARQGVLTGRLFCGRRVRGIECKLTFYTLQVVGTFASVSSLVTLPIVMELMQIYTCMESAHCYADIGPCF